MRRHIPNILTVGRLGLTLVNIASLAGALWVLQGDAAGGAGRGERASDLLWVATITFAVAAVTDFFDGWLARRWRVVSTLGAILDPIADKVLVAGALVGLVALYPLPVVMVPTALILMREFSVSALREVLAPKGLKLPVTFLAKTKTTLQLVAVTVLLGLLAVQAADPVGRVGAGDMRLLTGAVALLWLAAAVTVWTGVEYGLGAYRQLRTAPAGARP